MTTLMCGQPRSQGCIRTTLAQSNDSSILIGGQFFIPNSNELLKIVGDANSVITLSHPSFPEYTIYIYIIDYIIYYQN